METNQKPMDLLKSELTQLSALLSLNAKQGTNVETIALQEIEYLRIQALTKPDIMECLPTTIILAVKTVLKQNLSLDPYAGLVYVKTRSIKVNGEYKKALEIQPSANGLISIARQCGRLLDIKRAKVVKNTAGKVTDVSVDILLPTPGGTRWETFEFDESDFKRWQTASHKENVRNKADADLTKLNYSNANYTSFNGGIDPEFSRAKAIRHSLKKLGTNQNERQMDSIIIEDVKAIVIENVVDAKADMDASNDAENYTSYEQVDENIATVNVTVHEQVKVPNGAL